MLQTSSDNTYKHTFFGPQFFNSMDAAPDRNITQLVQYTDSQKQYKDWNYKNLRSFDGMSVPLNSPVVLIQDPNSGKYKVRVNIQVEQSRVASATYQGETAEFKVHNGFQHYGTAEISIDYQAATPPATSAEKPPTPSSASITSLY